MGLLTQLFVGGLVLMSGQDASLSVSQAIAEFNGEVQKLSAAKNLTRDTYFGAAEVQAKKIAYSKMTTKDAKTFVGTPMLITGSGYQGLSDWLSSYKASDEQGQYDLLLVKAMAGLMTRVDGKSETVAEKISRVDALLAHSKSAGPLTGEDSVMLANITATAAGESVLSNKAFGTFSSAVGRGVSPAAAPMVAEVWNQWVTSNGAHPMFEAHWSSFHSGLKMALATAEGVETPNSREVSGLKRAITKMESPMGRGKFVGFPAPNINFQWISDGTAKSLADYKGKVVIIDFWATWCGPCIASMPKLRELAAHYAGQPVVVLGVTSIQGSFTEDGKQLPLKDKPAEEIAMYPAYIERQKINWTIAVSNENVFNPDYGVDGIPHMAIVDAKGVVRHTGLHPGALTLDEKKKLIDPLIKEIK